MKKIRKLFLMLFICVQCFSLLPIQNCYAMESESISAVQPERKNASTKLFSAGDLINAIQMPRLSGGLNGYFYVEGAVSWGFCAENGKDFWYHNEAKSGYLTEWDDATIRKILYYAPGSPGYTGTDMAYDMDNATFATGYLCGMSSNNARAKAYIAYLQDLVDPIVWGYKAYRIDITPDNYQDVAFLAYVPKGNLEIVKYSACMEATEGNENYSLAGAVYGIYAADGEYSTPEYTLTLSAWKDGWSGLPVGAEYGWGRIELPPGDYWIKEITAPPGYELDPNWYPSYSTPITVTSATTVRVNTTNNPKMFPAEILLSKVREEEHSISLEGALFQVTHYGVLLENKDTNPENLESEQLEKINKKSWIFRTNENGFSYYEKEFLSSGDDLYYDSDGKPSLPIGTIIIQEIKAPEGYLKNDQIFIRQITSETSGGMNCKYLHPVISEATMDLHITKRQAHTETSIPGVTFEHKRPNGSIEQIVTNSNGTIRVKGLHYGVHELREISAPEGYVICENVISFSVAEDNTVTFLSEAMEGIVPSVSPEGNVEITIYNKVAPFGLVLHKQNDIGEKLEGAEFSLYYDEECTKLVQTLTTGIDGQLQFENLCVGTKYYLKETKAPTGYKTSVDEDGKPVVIEIYVESIPVQDKLDLYINGQLYDWGREGTFTLEGTKGKREIHITAVNERGYELPKTGSSMSSILTVLGIIFFLLGTPSVLRDKNIKKIKERKKNMIKIKKNRKWLALLFAMIVLMSSMASVLASEVVPNVERQGVINLERGSARIVIRGNEGQSLKGKSFQLYRVMNVENAVGLESVNYTFNPEFQEEVQNVIGSKIDKSANEVTESDVVQYIQSLNQNMVEGAHTKQGVEGNESAFRYFVEEIRNEIYNSGKCGETFVVSSVGEDNTITIEGLEYGYYIVDEITHTQGTEQASSLCIVDTANGEANVNIKSDYPTITQKILEDDNQDGWNDIGDYEIGQEISFRVESQVPNLNGYDTYYYAWHDMMDEALTLQRDTIGIQILDSTKAYTYKLLDEEYTIKENLENGESFVVEIEDLKKIVDREFSEQGVSQESIYGQQVVLTYQAKMNENASNRTGRNAIENDVCLEFSNNPDSDGKGETGLSARDTVVCFTYGLDIVKENNHNRKLEGAKFKLYLDEACTQEVVVKKINDGYSVIGHADLEPSLLDEADEMLSDEKGAIVVNGLDAGIYYLKETEAPSGYRKLKDAIKITVTPTFPSERDQYAKGEGMTNKILQKLMATATGSDISVEKELVTDVEQGRIHLTVVNEVGKKLPITGSTMNIVMTLAGVLLVGVYIVSRTKNEKVD